jgi:anti-sigma factor RsiW
MRLADVMFRRGHLSDSALIQAVTTGSRPTHIDQCDLCAERIVEMGRWLDALRRSDDEQLDAAFPPERLAAQQAQILRRLAQLDEPARVIAFPSHFRPAMGPTGRRVAAAWVGVAAAAGLVIGVIGGQVSARLDQQKALPNLVVVQAPTSSEAQAAAATTPADISVIDEELDGFTPASLQPINDITPRLVTTLNVKRMDQR